MFRLQVFYQEGEGAKWTNVYHVRGTTVTDALTAFTANMQTHLLTLLHSSCRIVKALSSDVSSDAFQEISVEEGGTSSFTDSRLPFFDCVKVAIATTDPGRPDIKFMKGWLTEGNSSSGSIDDLALADFLTEFNDMITAMDGDDFPLISENNQPWLTATASPLIQMRQMHRKRRRTPAP